MSQTLQLRSAIEWSRQIRSGIKGLGGLMWQWLMYYVSTQLPSYQY